MLLLMLLLTFSAEVEKNRKPIVGEGFLSVSAPGFEPGTVCLEGTEPNENAQKSTENEGLSVLFSAHFLLNVTDNVTRSRSI